MDIIWSSTAEFCLPGSQILIWCVCGVCLWCVCMVHVYMYSVYIHGVWLNCDFIKIHFDWNTMTRKPHEEIWLHILHVIIYRQNKMAKILYNVVCCGCYRVEEIPVCHLLTIWTHPGDCGNEVVEDAWPSLCHLQGNQQRQQCVAFNARLSFLWETNGKNINM